MSEPKSEYITQQEVEDGLEMFWHDKPKELPSVLSGFTPAPDVLIKRYGYVTALVWGKIWRYCQMPDGVCRAKLEKIAGDLDMSIRTIIRHIDPLVADGYLRDTTPNRKNRPHIYADTGKIRIRVNVEAAMTESHGAVTESHGHRDRESLEESNKKKQVKKVKERATPARPKANTYPTLVTFRNVTKRYPHEANWQEVIDAFLKINLRLGRDATADDLLPFYKFWTGKGYNPYGLGWLEWAVSGQLPKNGKVAAQSTNRVQSVLTEWLSNVLPKDEEIIDGIAN